METRFSPQPVPADYAMALELTSQLTLVLDEDGVQHRIMDIFEQLYAPGQLVFWVIDEGTLKKILAKPELTESPDNPTYAGSELPELLPDGFCLRIPYKEETLGIIEARDLAFPEFREQYLSIALTIAKVCGLAMANARTHSRLASTLSELSVEYQKSARLAEELQEINESLEERVRERTKSLEISTLKLQEEIGQRRAAESEVRHQLEEKTLLLRELHHRVKNNLQLIISMLSIRERKARDPVLRRELGESRNGIRTMAIIHERLWTEEDLSRIDLVGMIRGIIANLFSLYQTTPKKVSSRLDIPAIAIDINTAIPLGLLLNELISNSLQHAFPDDTAGEISISIREEGAEIHIVYRDNGTGFPSGITWENPDSYGLILIHSLIEQLQGSIDYHKSGGAEFDIRFRKMSEVSGAISGTYNRVAE